MQLCVYCLNRLLCDVILKRHQEPSHQVGALHNDLATALDGAGQLSNAESHARTSLEILSQSHSRDTAAEYLTRVYYNLGMILSHQGQFLFYVWKSKPPKKEPLNRALGSASY